jgi:hypothetical protein
MTIPSALVHSDAILTAVGAAVTVYDADGPAQPHGAVPYAVIRTDSGDLSGSLGNRHSDLTLTVWVTSVGGTREQAQWVADEVRAVMLDSPPAVTGRTAQPAWQQLSQPVSRDDGLEPPLFYAVAAYRLHTSA